MCKYYTGIGSRETPPEICLLMTSLAKWLDNLGWTLRTGDAKAADSAFAKGANKKEIYTANHARGDILAEAIAKALHPRWDLCGEYARLLHTRNVYQVMGKTLDVPSKFLICWTPDGCRTHESRSMATGGTGQAISIACKFSVPVFNLKNHDDQRRIIASLEKREL